MHRGEGLVCLPFDYVSRHISTIYRFIRSFPLSHPSFSLLFRRLRHPSSPTTSLYSMSAGPDPHWPSLLVSTAVSITPTPLPLTPERITLVLVLKDNTTGADLTDLLAFLTRIDPNDCRYFLLISSPEPPWERVSALLQRPNLLYWTTTTWASSA